MRRRWLLITLLAAGLVWRLALSWQPLERIAGFPVVDDGFYSLSIARNLALGLGMTCDGIHPTNGFQPLYVFLAAPLYWLFPGDKALPVHLTLSALSILSVFTGFLIFKLVKLLANEKAALFAVLLWCLSPTVIEFELNGLETGLYVFLLALSSYYYLAYIRDSVSAKLRPDKKEAPSKGSYALLGGLLGLTVLARIDGLFYCLVMGIDFLWLNRKQWQKVTRPALIVIGVCILVAGPWFLNNLYNFGSLMPVSGQAVRLLSLSPAASTFQAAGEQFPIDPIPLGYYGMNIKKSLLKMGRAPLLEAVFWPGLFFGYHWLGYLLLLLAGGGGLALALVYPSQTREYLAGSGIGRLNYVLPFCIIMLAAYSLYVFGQWYYVRYYFPLLFVSILYSGFAYDLFFNRLLPCFNETLAKGLKFALIFFLLISLNYRVGERFFSPGSGGKKGHHRYYYVADWINKNLPPEARIGAFQSGIIGYFSQARVINLDGVVNQDAFQAIKDKRMLEYIENSGIQYVMDWQWMIEDYLWKSSQPPVDRQRLRLLQADIYGYNLYQVVANHP